jgi:hypothetical protein
MKKRIVSVLLMAFVLISIGFVIRSDETSNATIASSKEPEKRSTVESISALFEESGYSTKCEEVAPHILSGNQYVLFLDEDKLFSIYEYDTPDDAQKDADRVNKDGYSTDVACIDWVSTPHFFLCDNLILQYTGTDEAILAILTDLCGEQFAGGDITDLPALSYEEDLH